MIPRPHLAALSLAIGLATLFAAPAHATEPTDLPHWADDDDDSSYQASLLEDEDDEYEDDDSGEYEDDQVTTCKCRGGGLVYAIPTLVLCLGIRRRP